MILSRFNDKLNRIIETIIAILLVLMAIVIFMQVVIRIFKGSLKWSEELARYMMIYITFLGASVGVKKHLHISVEALVMLLSQKVNRFLEIIISIVLEGLFGIIIVYAFKLSMLTMNQISPVLKIKMGIVYMAITFGFILMFLYNFENIIKAIKGNEVAS